LFDTVTGILLSDIKTEMDEIRLSSLRVIIVRGYVAVAPDWAVTVMVKELEPGTRVVKEPERSWVAERGPTLTVA
jgi:hypothetical protein